MDKEIVLNVDWSHLADLLNKSSIDTNCVEVVYSLYLPKVVKNEYFLV